MKTYILLLRSPFCEFSTKMSIRKNVMKTPYLRGVLGKLKKKKKLKSEKSAAKRKKN